MTPEQQQAIHHVRDALHLMPPRDTTTAVFQADPGLAVSWFNRLRDILEEVSDAFTAPAERPQAYKAQQLGRAALDAMWGKQS